MKTSTILILLLTMLLFVSGFFGCGASPVQPGAPEQAAPERLINQSVIGPDGGTINSYWFTIEFRPYMLVEDTTVSIFEGEITEAPEGIAVGGYPIHVVVDSDAFIEYTVDFLTDKVRAEEGDFTSANKYVDIYGIWLEGGQYGRAAAWAKRDGNSIAASVNKNDITLALVDYSMIPQLTSQAIFTDDPRQLAPHYQRYAELVTFNPLNLGPLNGRIPVIFIHGLDITLPDEDEDFRDDETPHSEGYWEVLLNRLNGVNAAFTYFKFFWYAYPTGLTIWGEDGSAALLGDELTAWANANDPVLLEKPVIIIAHSMGGLVGREYMEHQGGNVFRIMTLNTPHYGSPLVNVGYDIGWFNSFFTDGIMDLACDETIKYKYLLFTHTSVIDENPGLRALNNDFAENDERLVCYGASSTSHPSPAFSDTLHYWGLTFLDMVTSPNWLKESYNGWHSDCVVNWPSQYYDRNGTSPDPVRNSTTKYHRNIFEDNPLVYRMYLDLMAMRAEYP